MKRIGRSVIALGAVWFLVNLAKPCTIDVTGLILIWAGKSVCRGSRNGALVALTICALLVFVAMTTAVYMVRGYPEIGTWQGSTVIALGAWALVNGVLLARARPAASGEPSVEATPNARRPVLQFSLRAMLALMLAVGIVLGLYKWYAQWHEPPPFATVQAIESKYSQQLARLRAAALGNAPHWINDPTNMKLFSSKEIVAAEFGWIAEGAEGPTGVTSLKERAADDVRSSVTPLGFSAGVERPVVYLRYDELREGKSERVAVYENQIIGKDGRGRLLYRLELDLRSLQPRDDERPSSNSSEPPTKGTAASR
jgi:hypothetical protein